MFCLLALDRRKEAEEAIELIIKVNPFYQPSDTQVSPRIVAVFQDVRRSLLPAVLQRFYTDAKAAYGRRIPGATAQFDRVLALLAELDASRSPALADLHAAATGFRDLSKANDALIATPVASAAPAAAHQLLRTSCCASCCTGYCTSCCSGSPAQLVPFSNRDADRRHDSRRSSGSSTVPARLFRSECQRGEGGVAVARREDAQ